jgi:hypothetical protein
MRETNIGQAVATIIRASCEDANQASIERHSQLDQLAAQEAPPGDGGRYDLHRESYVADLTSLSGHTSAQLAHEGHEFRDARFEAQLFLDQHVLARHPPYRYNVSYLWLTLLGTMLGEAVLTSPIYAPAVGWVEALFLGAVIAVGVAAPATGAGVGVVMARHRINAFVRVAGMVIAAGCIVLVATALLIGTHFRPIAADQPALMHHPGELAQGIWRSFEGNPFGQIVEPANWGLMAAGAVAAFLVAKEVYRTYGYIGWRPLATREEAALRAIRLIEERAKSVADGRRRARIRSMDLEVREAARSREAIRRILGLDEVVASARAKALQRIGVEATRAWRILLEGGAVGSDAAVDRNQWDVAEPDRSSFRIQTERSLVLHQKFIDAQPRAIAMLTELYAAFCASLNRAVSHATTGGPRSAGPVLDGPGARS